MKRVNIGTKFLQNITREVYVLSHFNFNTVLTMYTKVH